MTRPHRVRVTDWDPTWTFGWLGLSESVAPEFSSTLTLSLTLSWGLLASAGPSMEDWGAWSMTSRSWIRWIGLTKVPREVLTDTVLTTPSLPGCTLVTTPMGHSSLGVLSSLTITTDPIWMSPFTRPEPPGGKLRMHSWDHTSQNLSNIHFRTWLRWTKSSAVTRRSPVVAGVNGHRPIRKWAGVRGAEYAGSSPTNVRGRELRQASISCRTVSNSVLDRVNNPTDRLMADFIEALSLSHQPPHQGALGAMNSHCGLSSVPPLSPSNTRTLSLHWVSTIGGRTAGVSHIARLQEVPDEEVSPFLLGPLGPSTSQEPSCSHHQDMSTSHRRKRRNLSQMHPQMHGAQLNQQLTNLALCSSEGPSKWTAH